MVFCRRYRIIHFFFPRAVHYNAYRICKNNIISIQEVSTNSFNFFFFLSILSFSVELLTAVFLLSVNLQRLLTLSGTLWCPTRRRQPSPRLLNAEQSDISSAARAPSPRRAFSDRTVRGTPRKCAAKGKQV